MTTSPYTPDALGCTRATEVRTEGTNAARPRKAQKADQGSDCSLQPDCMKPEVASNRGSAMSR